MASERAVEEVSMARAQLAPVPRRPGQRVDSSSSDTHSTNCRRRTRTSLAKMPTPAQSQVRRQSQTSQLLPSRRSLFPFLPTSAGSGLQYSALACHLLLVFVLLVHLPLDQSVRASQLAMNLPDGIENILGFVPKSTFKCERDGYFGDIDNDCRIFHLCQRNTSPGAGAGAKSEWRHWTYACGNQTMFNQLTLTCAFVDEAIPCQHSSQFQYLNEVIHRPAEPFLTDADVTSGVSYYSNRIMSDGARARAFQDSQLLAQIGGASVASASKPQPQQQAAAFVSAPLSTSSALLEPETGSEAGSNQEATSSLFGFQSNLGPSLLQNTFQPTNRLGSRNSFQTATNSFVGQQQQPQQQQQSQQFRQPASSHSPIKPLQLDSSRAQSTQEASAASTSGVTSSHNLQPSSKPEANLVENHAWQLEHQPAQQQQQQQQQPRQQFTFSQPWQQRWQETQAQQQPQPQIQPQAASSDSWQQFSSAQVDRDQQSQASSGGQPNSFQFSISTNHHASSDSPFNTFVASSTSSDNTNDGSRQRPQQFAAPRASTTNANANAKSDQVDLSGPTVLGAGLATFTAAPVSSVATTEPLQVVPSSTLPTIELQQSQQPTATSAPTTGAVATTPTTTTSSTDAPLPSSTLATSSNFGSGQSLQLVQPTQATPSTVTGSTATATTTTATSPPTTQATTTTTTATSAASGTGGAARRALAGANSSSGRRLQQGVAARRSNDLSSFDRSHVGFQSERLSAVSRRMAAASNAADTPLVMRRNSNRPPISTASSVSTPSINQTQQQQPNRTNNNRSQQQQQQQQQRQQQPASGSLARTSSALLDTAGDSLHLHSPASLGGGDFWRRSFDSQLMAPKFESILLRRRV